MSFTIPPLTFPLLCIVSVPTDRGTDRTTLSMIHSHGATAVRRSLQRMLLQLGATSTLPMALTPSQRSDIGLTEPQMSRYGRLQWTLSSLPKGNSISKLQSLSFVFVGKLSKVTNSKMARELSMLIQCGPTNDQQPTFSWSSSDFGDSVRHEGQPDVFDFPPVLSRWSTN